MLQQLGGCRAGAVLLEAGAAKHLPSICAALLSDNPRLDFARCAELFHQWSPPEPGVAPTATLDEAARLHPSVHVGPGAYVGPGCELAEGVSVGPNCSLLGELQIGEKTRLVANVVVYPRVLVGARCLLHAGVTLGGEGLGYERGEDGRWHKLAQVGGLRIGNDVEIGASSNVDAGTMDPTRIGDGVKMDSEVHIGHNVQMGAHSLISANSCVGGSTVLGERTLIAGGVAVSNGLRIADDCVIGGGAVVFSSFDEPGTQIAGVVAAMPRSQWWGVWRQMLKLGRPGRNKDS